MEAQVWTLIGILAAALLTLGGGAFLGYQNLTAKIETQGADLRASIDAQGADLRRSIESQGADLRGSIDALTDRFMSHLERHAADT